MGRIVRSLALVAFLVSPCLPAFAELDSEEQAWVKQLIDRLGAKSEKVRSGAEDALVAAGVDVIDVLAAKSVKPGDTSGAALERVAVRLGREASAKRLENLAAAVSDPARKKRYLDLAARLRPVVPGAELNAEVAAKVAAILAPLDRATSFSSTDPSVERLVELGHDAVPVLLAQLMKRRAQFGGMSSTAAQYALVQLAVQEDIPALRETLVAGVEDVADALAKLLEDGHGEALAALHEGVQANVMGFDVCEGLEKTIDSVATSRVVVDWLKRRTDAPEHEVAAAAKLLGSLGATDAIEPLFAWLARGEEAQTIDRVGKALVSLGDTRGIPVLVAIAGQKRVGRMRRADFSSSSRAAAVAKLDEISGQTHDAAKIRGSDRAPSAESEASFAAAHADFVAWWDAVKDKIVFDRVSKTWSVPK